MGTVRHRNVFLHPGEFCFGDEHTRISTLLGSCVAITLWHPQLLVGGMCHFLLPSRGTDSGLTSPQGMYADEAIALFDECIRAYGTSFVEYQAKIFGGGNMFPTLAKPGHSLNVADKNVTVAESLLLQLRVPVVARDIGGIGHRKIVFDIATGHVWLTRRQAPENCNLMLANLKG